MPLPLRTYLAATHLAPLVARWALRKRGARGKEDAVRWTEKLGQPGVPRPAGTLIWLHAVGLGEVLSLRGLITAMAGLTDAHFLVTSSTTAGAKVLAKNMPPRTTHQYLPLDAPKYRRTFLDHWQPDLCIWAEQDLWPGFVTDLAKRNIRQTMIAVRVSVDSYRKKKRFGASFAYLYNQMDLITAYDKTSATHLQKLGAGPIKVTGSLKPAAPPLTYNPADLEALQTAIGDRVVWITAPSHPADEKIALAAHKLLRQRYTNALLILAPRDPNRDIAPGLPTAIRSQGQLPSPDDTVYLADTLGDLGLLYRLADAAFIGGTNDATEGHSPWEAAALDTAILHGPRTANFAADYAVLKAESAAICVQTAEDLLDMLMQDLTPQKANAHRVIETSNAAVNALAPDLLALI